jgi:protein-tyrosine phosphatase
MIDIHHHLLWGTDDGAKDFETSLAMAKASAQDGVTHVVCTPHASGRYSFNAEANARKAAELQQRLDQDGIALKIGMGCDFHMTYDNIVEAKANPAKFSINGLGYLMVEIPDYGVPPGMAETFYELQLAGLIPVLTHPERNPTLQADESRLAEWLRAGVLVQVTGDSVTGKMGKSAEKMSHRLLARRWVHFLATDAHNVTSRPPRLSQARDLVARKYGAAYAESLVETNPLAAFEGRRFNALEEPLALYEEYKEEPWWKRLFA